LDKNKCPFLNSGNSFPKKNFFFAILNNKLGFELRENLKKGTTISAQNPPSPRSTL
jgi:hypothetical protein